MKKINHMIKIVCFLLLLLPFAQIGITYTNGKLSSIKSTRSDTWILDLQTNGFDNPQWYYTHLNDQDRLKIRQALDWSVDRNHIINDINNGFGAPTFSFISPSTEYFLNNGTIPRQQNLTIAKNLLAEVFGYTYDPNTDNKATPYDETQPYFKMTPIYSLNQPKRVQWANEISNTWKSLGIDIISVDMSLATANDRFNPSIFENGTDYAHGAYDTAFLQWGDNGVKFRSPALQVSYINDYDLAFIKFNNSFYDKIVKTIIEEQNSALRNQALANYQQWMYDTIPLSFLFSADYINIKNKDLIGINPFVRTNYENWTYGSKQNVTIALSDWRNIQFFNPAFFCFNLGYPDYSIATDALFRGLFYTTTDPTTSSIEKTITYPYFADWYNQSADGKTWFVNLKQGLKWHDGYELNTSDIQFTFDSLGFTNTNAISLPLQYMYYWVYQGWNFGDTHITVYNSTLVKFDLDKPYSYFKEDILTLKLLPKHVLEKISLDNWYSDSFNQGINGSLIGNGPYILVNQSNSPYLATLQKWQDWDTPYNTLIATNSMNEMIPGAVVPSINYINFMQISNVNDVLNAIKNGTADITLQYSPQLVYDFSSIYNQITSPVEPIIERGNSPQFILYNFKSPIWGMNPVEPCIVHKFSCILTTTTIIDSTTPTTTPTTTSTPYSSIEVILSSMMVISILVLIRKKNR